MRVLWISSSGGNYKSKSLYDTANWVGALQNALLESKGVELAITFPHSTDRVSVVDGRTTYYPVKRKNGRGKYGQILFRYFGNTRKEENLVIEGMLSAIIQFKPDIVHVWGIENFYSRIIKSIVDIPSVVHIQGFASAIVDTYLPQGFTVEDIKKSQSFRKRLLMVGHYQVYKDFLRRVQNEKEVAPFVKNWMGRTEWDKLQAIALSPTANYYHCDELLNKTFADAQWKYHYDGETLMLQSSITNNWYKGVDLVLQTAKTLVDRGQKIRWNIFGMTRTADILTYISKHYGINPDEYGIIFKGYVNSETIKEGLLQADVFVHVSHVENSSNAIAEAQMVGTPVVALNVGGNSTMLKEGAGVIVPTKSPYDITNSILKFTDKFFAVHISDKERKLARKRHDKTTVIENLLSIYESLIQ